MVNDPIADLLTRIRNGILRNKKEIIVPTSKKIESIISILKEEGFISDFYNSKTNDKEYVVVLKYYEDGKSRVHHLERVSKPGLRIYKGYRDIPKILNGLGVSILSTPKGIMTGKKATLERVGGEYLCKIW